MTQVRYIKISLYNTILHNKIFFSNSQMLRKDRKKKPKPVKFFIMNLFFFCKSLFSLLSKAILNRGKRRQNLTFCDPSINRSVHNSICVCVEASMWKHAGLRDIKPFPLNIIWPYESYSQRKAYVRISWKKCVLSLCYREPTHFTSHSPGKLIMEVTLVQELGEGMVNEHNVGQKKEKQNTCKA